MRFGALGVLLLGAGALLHGLLQARLQPPLESSWTGAFQVLGAPLKLADRAVTRVLPVDELDERDLGEVYRASFDPQAEPASREQRYLDSLMAELQPHAGRTFRYRAYVLESDQPNAMALPGGVLLVTRGLLSTLGGEDELVAVLAHEMGHVERGHCFDAVRFELLGRKVRAATLGELADFGSALLLRHSYSKTMEHEADVHAFGLVARTAYDPRGLARSFDSLLEHSRGAGDAGAERAGPLRDYFGSHPPLRVRAAEFRAQADAWWRRHPDERRYVGARNLQARVARSRHELDAEWTGAPPVVVAAQD